MKKLVLLSLLIGLVLLLARGAGAAPTSAPGTSRLAASGAFSLDPLNSYSLAARKWSDASLRLALVDGSKIKPLDSSSASAGSSALSAEQMKSIRRAKKWSNVSIFFLVGNAASLPIMLAVNTLAGGIISILTLGGWEISHGQAAFAYRDLEQSYLANNTAAPSPKTPRFAHIIAAAFGVGAMTGIGLSFSDTTGTAIIMTSICSAVSWISGIVGIVATHNYAKKVGYSSAGAVAPSDYAGYQNRMSFSELQGKGRNQRTSSAIYVPLAAVTF